MYNLFLSGFRAKIYKPLYLQSFTGKNIIVYFVLYVLPPLINTNNTNEKVSKLPSITAKTFLKNLFIIKVYLLLFVYMSINSVILLLGSNLKNKKKNLELAKQLINQEIAEIIKESEILESEAEDYESSNTFVNQTIKIYTDLSIIQ